MNQPNFVTVMSTKGDELRVVCPNCETFCDLVMRTRHAHPSYRIEWVCRTMDCKYVPKRIRPGRIKKV